MVKKSTLLLSGLALGANNQPSGSLWKYGFGCWNLHGSMWKEMDCHKRRVPRLTHEVVQRFLEWDSLHYIPNHAKQDSLVIHRHDEKTTLRTPPPCRKYQNGLVTLVHQPLASSFNYFFGFPLGAHLPGKQHSRPLPWRLCYYFLLHCPLRGLWLDYAWAVGWDPRLSQGMCQVWVSLTLFTLFKCPEMMILKEFDWRQESANMFCTRSGGALFALHVRSVTARIQVCFYVWILRSLRVCPDVLLTQSQFMGQNRQQISWTIAISCEKGSFFAFKFSLAPWRIGIWKSLKS